MTTFIPAAPGWYVHESDDGGEGLDPVIAWQPTTSADGEAILLPVVDAGPGSPPFVLSEEAFKFCNRSVVYRPSHDPGDTPNGTPAHGGSNTTTKEIQ